MCQIQCECDKVTCAATTAPEFRLNDNSSASRASFLHFPFSTSDLPASCRGFLLLLVHFADLIKMYDFSSFDEMKYNFSTRCVCCAARTSLQLQFLGAARDIDIFISQYICINSDCSGTIKDRTACRQRYERECKLSNTYLNFVVCCIREINLFVHTK